MEEAVTQCLCGNKFDTEEEVQRCVENHRCRHPCAEFVSTSGEIEKRCTQCQTLLGKVCTEGREAEIYVALTGG